MKNGVIQYPVGAFMHQFVSGWFVAVVLILLPVVTALAQTSSAIPAKDQLIPGQPNGIDVTQQIDNLLGGQGFGDELMGGIQGFGLNIAKAIEMKVLDEVVEAIANASVLAPIATTIMKVYEKVKSNNLAAAIDEVKEVHRDALSLKLKLKYQHYKLNYGEWAANTRKSSGLVNSVTEEQALALFKRLYPNYVGVMDEYYNRPNAEPIVNATKNMGWYLFQEAAGLSNHEDLDLKLNLANKEYKENNGSEVYAISAYDRIRLRQEANAEASRRNASLLYMQQVVRARINVERAKRMEQDLGKYIKLNSQTH